MKTLGFDPGGSSSGFGCAHVDFDTGIAATETVASVDEAVDWALRLIPVNAAGIDTLLFWQSTRAGWRGADEYLRTRYPAVSNSVVSANGLYGSMSVQGAVLAFRLRELWPTIFLTETHPKILWTHLFPRQSYPRTKQPSANDLHQLRTLSLPDASVKDEHQLDALLSAWAAFQSVTGRWKRDLIQVTANEQTRPNLSLAPDVHYCWPD